MTREEALTRLKQVASNWRFLADTLPNAKDAFFYKHEAEAIEMAIKALEQYRDQNETKPKSLGFEMVGGWRSRR